MNFMSVGTTGIEASRLILGCMRMSELSVAEAADVLTAAHASGINFYDHADIYGGGKSETVFAQAAKAAGLKRDELFLQSKVGIRKGFFDFSKEHIVSSVEGILDRLETDHLDFLLLHRPDTLVEPEEVAAAFEHLEQSGKVKYFGVSNQNPMQIELLQKYLPMKLQANQLQFGPAHTPMVDAGFNVNMLDEAGLNRDGSILDYSRLKQMTIQPWSPFQVDLSQGLFIKHPAYQELTAKLQAYADERGVTLEAIVMAWILRHPAMMQPIVGSMNPERITKMCEGTTVELSRQEWYDIYLSAGNSLP